MEISNPEQLKIELEHCAPEGHRAFQPAAKLVEEPRDLYGTVWCPWAYKEVGVMANHNLWPTCNGCLRPVNLNEMSLVHLRRTI